MMGCEGAAQPFETHTKLNYKFFVPVPWKP